MIGDEAPEYGFPGPERLGGSPVGMHLLVDDADAAIEHAVQAGATLVQAATNQFYGDRSGRVTDPFGYTWTIAMRREEMSVPEMQRRMAEMMAQQMPQTAASYRREGFRAVTPYIVVNDAAGLIEFTKRAFGAEETMRADLPGGGVHGEVRIGDSMLMVGVPSAASRRPAVRDRIPPLRAGLRRRVPTRGRRRRDAGAGPRRCAYGERSGAVRDAFGNTWYVATAQGPRYVPERLHTLNVYLHPHRAEPLLAFLVKAFGADEMAKFATPDGIVMHAHARIGGDSVVEMGEARGGSFSRRRRCSICTSRMPTRPTGAR